MKSTKTRSRSLRGNRPCGAGLLSQTRLGWAGSLLSLVALVAEEMDEAYGSHYRWCTAVSAGRLSK
jgi:hypothetical protein